jgi:hypothetical protein
MYVCVCTVRLIVVIARGRGMAGLTNTRYGQASKTEPGRFGVLCTPYFSTSIVPTGKHGESISSDIPKKTVAKC